LAPQLIRRWGTLGFILLKLQVPEGRGRAIKGDSPMGGLEILQHFVKHADEAIDCPCRLPCLAYRKRRQSMEGAMHQSMTIKE